MTLTRLGIIGVAAMLCAGPASAENSALGREALSRDVAQGASDPAPSGQSCLSVDARDNGLSYRGFPSSTGHTQEITTQSADTFVTYTCPIEQGVVVVAKLGRNLFGGCRFADRYEMTFVPTTRRLKIDGAQKDCVASVLSKRGV